MSALPPEVGVERARESPRPGELVIAVVGDLLVTRPVTQLVARDAGFRRVLNALGHAQAAFGNLETTLVDPSSTEGEPQGWEDEFPVHSDLALAEDLRAMSFRLLGRANNHAMDWGRGSLEETDIALGAAGLVHAGAGPSASASRAPRYLDLAEGRIGLVSVTTSPAAPSAIALDPWGGGPGRAGVNTIVTRRVITVPSQTFSTVRGVLDVVPELDTRWIPRSDSGPDEIELGHISFKLGDGFEENFELDQAAVRENLRSVRLASQHADVSMLAIHAHQGDRRPEEPRPFLRELAHRAIDAGASVVTISGPHRMGPVELYRSGVIFYGLGNFFWHMLEEPMQSYIWRDLGPRLEERFADASVVTQADVNRWLSEDWEEDAFYDAAIAKIKLAGGSVERIEVIPVALSPGPALPSLGIPRRGQGADAMRILEGLRTISKPLGTTMTVDTRSDPDGPIGTISMTLP